MAPVVNDTLISSTSYSSQRYFWLTALVPSPPWPPINGTSNWQHSSLAPLWHFQSMTLLVDDTSDWQHSSLAHLWHFQLTALVPSSPLALPIDCTPPLLPFDTSDWWHFCWSTALHPWLTFGTSNSLHSSLAPLWHFQCMALLVYGTSYWQHMSLAPLWHFQLIALIPCSPLALPIDDTFDWQHLSLALFWHFRFLWHFQLTAALVPTCANISQGTLNWWHFSRLKPLVVHLCLVAPLWHFGFGSTWC